jgi:hypothetical protein
MREFGQRAVNCADLMEYIGIFQQCWDFLARSDVNIGVSLSPRFPTPTSDKLIDLITPVFKFKRMMDGRIPSVVGSGGNLVLTGPQGIGKPTMLSVCHVLCTLLAEHMWTVYYSYERNHCFDIGSLHTPVTLRSRKFAVSEQTVLVKRSLGRRQSLRDRKARIVHQLSQIARSPLGICFVAGSSVDTYSMAIHPTRYGLPSLSGSVFMECRLQPVRDFDCTAG